MVRFRGWLAMGCVSLLSTIQSANESAANTIRTVALSEQSAPGAADGTVFESFDSPALNRIGQVAFRASLDGPSVHNTTNLGIWSEGSGKLTLMAQRGDSAAGTESGVYYSSLGAPFTISALGKIAFRASLDGGDITNSNNTAIWSDGSGPLDIVVREGSHAPGAPDGVNFMFIPDVVALNAGGQTAFHATLSGIGVNTTNDEGIWSEKSGNLILIARAGDQAAGTPNGVSYSTFWAASPALNSAGQIAFHATVTGVGVDATNNEGIWFEDAGALALIARNGDQAPGVPAGVNFKSFWSNSPALNSRGQTAFLATLAGIGVGTINDEGIWTDRSGVLGLVVRKGDPTPNMFPSVTFGEFDSPLFNAAGQIAFTAELAGAGVDGTNDKSIWSERSSALTLIARSGGQAEGTPGGIQYADFNVLALNALGQSAFHATLTGIGIDSTNNTGIWATDSKGNVQLIARMGDLLEIAPSDFRTVSFLGFVGNTGNEDGRPSGFNDLGQLAFYARFTDGSEGIFVSNLVAVPEPESLLIIALFTMMFTFQHRRHFAKSHSRGL